jgi:precorrin-2 dehydrogenase/sirohydrochlorin ferrochelatase
VRYFPVYLGLEGRPCVVIGGGEVAERKVESLLGAGARVTVISRSLTPALAGLAETHEIMHHAREYRAGDLGGAALAFAATDDETVQAAIANDAARSGVLLNVVDRPQLCSFIMPAVLTRGAVTVAISTAGASPALARRIRDDLEAQLGDEYGLAATILGKLRPIVTGAEPDQSRRARVFTALVDSPLLDALRAHDGARVDAILARLVGPSTTLAALGISLEHRAAPDGTPAP